jgi:hypothetical protein
MKQVKKKKTEKRKPFFVILKRDSFSFDGKSKKSDGSLD